MNNFVKLTNKSNDYKLGERTQVKFCFTVKGKQYALILVNTLKNALFESYENFDIYACDKESKQILTKYRIPYRNSFGIDVYNDKVLNAIKTSIENKDTLIIALDSLMSFDFHMVRGLLGRLHYKKNTLYYPSYFDIFGDESKKSSIMANTLLYYNIDEKVINQYLKLLYITKQNITTYNDDDLLRYSKETVITEESVLTKHKRKLPLKHFSKALCNKVSLGIRYCGGGKTLMNILNTGNQYCNMYYVNNEILQELLSDRTEG